MSGWTAVIAPPLAELHTTVGSVWDSATQLMVSCAPSTTETATGLVEIPEK